MSDLTKDDRVPLVVTHAGCPDGYCCEWLYRRHFGDRAKYTRAKYGDPVPLADAQERPHVYLSDFSWPIWEMRALAGACRGRMTVIDHHETAQPTLDAIRQQDEECPPSALQPMKIIFDMKHCGAYLTWQHLKSNGAIDSVFADGNPPLIVQYVEDRDLWSWRLPDSREISAAINSYPRSFDVWNELHNLLSAAGSDGYWRLVREGSAILRAIDNEVNKACAAAIELTIAGHLVKAVNTTVHHSEIGGQLAENRAFGATFHDDLKRGVRVWSLRSHDGGLKVNDIAKQFGGGGHPSAAGFNRPLSEPFIALA